MSYDAELNRIRAEAFQELEAAYEQALDASSVGTALVAILDTTRQKIRGRASRFADTLNLLASTRWKRLQQTQFVYWSTRSGHPRIEQPNGERSYLQERVELIEIAESELLERLADAEARLFGAVGADENKVFWQDWEILPCVSPHKVLARCRYCIAYIWEDGLVTHVPSSYEPPRVYNLNNPDDRPSYWPSQSTERQK